jgi:hypothetical protein
MIIATRPGWQTTLADLALILFIITAAAMAERPNIARPAETPVSVPASGEPLAIYRAARDAPGLAEWLGNQPQDGRQNLTIVARYAPGQAQGAAMSALALQHDALAAGHSARIIVEPGESTDVVAVLDFDGRESGTAIAVQPSP